MNAISRERFTSADARNGAKTCLFRNKYLHSAYDPFHEAENYLKKTGINQDRKIYVLIFPGMNYLAAALEKDGRRILSIHVSRFFIENKAAASDQSCTISEDVYGFLKKNISMYEIGNLEIIFYQPICNVFPDEGDSVAQIIRDFLLETGSSRLTVKRFGSKWIKNVFHNLAGNGQRPDINIEKPVLLMGSGPGLSAIQNYSERINEVFTVFSFSSAYRIITELGIRSDYVFHTDPGHYAGYYLGEIVSDNKTLIAPFTVRRGIFGKASVFPLNTGMNIEKQLFRTDPHAPAIYDNGSVATTAVMFLQSIGVKNIYTAGIDLACDDVLSHAKGHAHYDLLDSGTCRTNPLLGILYKKRLLIAPDKRNGYFTGASLDVYAKWFKQKGMKKAAIFALKEAKPLRKVFPLAGIDRAAKAGQMKIKVPYPNIEPLEKFPENYRKALMRELENKDAVANIPAFTETTLAGELMNCCAFDEYERLTENYNGNPEADKLKQLADEIIDPIMNAKL